MWVICAMQSNIHVVQLGSGAAIMFISRQSHNINIWISLFQSLTCLTCLTIKSYFFLLLLISVFYFFMECQLYHAVYWKLINYSRYGHWVSLHSQIHKITWLSFPICDCLIVKKKEIFRKHLRIPFSHECVYSLKL